MWGAHGGSLLPPCSAGPCGGRGRTFESCRAHGSTVRFLEAKHLISGVVLAGGLLLAAGCSGSDHPAASGIRTGIAIKPQSTKFWVTFPKPLPIGQELGVQDVDITNQSTKPITIVGFRLDGTGAGSVIRVLHVYAVPFVNDNVSVPDSMYQIFPPSISSHGKCVVEKMDSFKGYVLAPAETVRAYALIRMASPGKLSTRADTIFYRTLSGQEEQQSVPIQLRMTVAKSAKPSPYTPDQLRCVPRVSRKLPL